MRPRMIAVEPKMIRHVRMYRPQQRNPLLDDGVDVENFRVHFRLAGELGKGAHAPLQ